MKAIQNMGSRIVRIQFQGALKLALCKLEFHCTHIVRGSQLNVRLWE